MFLPKEPMQDKFYTPQHTHIYDLKFKNFVSRLETENSTFQDKEAAFSSLIVIHGWTNKNFSNMTMKIEKRPIRFPVAAKNVQKLLPP